jgi:pimeloyl-ACP methyl ester carboxylesterase
MPLTTTEVPTFFGPPDSPLFGVVHLPVDNQIRGGVLICGSLGKEGMDSVRLHRTLAEGLASRGFAVLHFDYLGSGNSAYAQGRPDAVANWVASVGHALDYLALIGAESVTAVGVRAGCLILDEYLARSNAAVNRAVYLDPPGTGRRYLREHTTLFRLSVGEGTPVSGEVSIIGTQLSDHAAAEFNALRLDADPISAHGVDNVLVVGRPAETDKRVLGLASAEGVDSIVVGGLQECARPRDFLPPVPYAAVDAIIEWIDGHLLARTYPAIPQYMTTVMMPAEGLDGADIVESIERAGPTGLFAIRTSPLRRMPGPAKTVLFFVLAKDLHVGPTREWVELSRRLAAAGSQALRWDPAGLNFSGHISREPYRLVYRKDDLTDSIAVARHACQNADELELVGICSGAWYAAHVARNLGARSAILVNPRPWNWRITPTLLSQWLTQRNALGANAPSDTDGGAMESRPKRFKAPVGGYREPVKRFIHNHFPRYFLRALSWIGLVWLPDAILTTLARNGTGVTVIASPDDAKDFEARGGRATLDRLQRTSRPPRLIATSTGDHSAYHPEIWLAIRDAVLADAVVSPTERFPIPDLTTTPNLPASKGSRVLTTAHTGGPERDRHDSGGQA